MMQQQQQEITLMATTSPSYYKTNRKKKQYESTFPTVELRTKKALKYAPTCIKEFETGGGVNCTKTNSSTAVVL